MSSPTTITSPQATAVPYALVPYNPAYRQAFRDLNVAWVSHYFTVEPYDLKVLENPETFILEPGGQIFFAVHPSTQQVLGTAAIMPHPNGELELTKLAVHPSAQGQGIGLALIQACIAAARKRGDQAVYLETNAKLEAARRLYDRLGFQQIPFQQPSAYARADVRMVLWL